MVHTYNLNEFVINHSEAFYVMPKIQKISSSPHLVQDTGDLEDNDRDHDEDADGGQDPRPLGVIKGAALEAVGGTRVDLLDVPGAVHARPEREVGGGF